MRTDEVEVYLTAAAAGTMPPLGVIATALWGQCGVSPSVVIVGGGSALGLYCAAAALPLALASGFLLYGAMHLWARFQVSNLKLKVSLYEDCPENLQEVPENILFIHQRLSEDCKQTTIGYALYFKKPDGSGFFVSNINADEKKAFQAAEQIFRRLRLTKILKDDQLLDYSPRIIALDENEFEGDLLKKSGFFSKNEPAKNVYQAKAMKRAFMGSAVGLVLSAVALLSVLFSTSLSLLATAVTIFSVSLVMGLILGLTTTLAPPLPKKGQSLQQVEGGRAALTELILGLTTTLAPPLPKKRQSLQQVEEGRAVCPPAALTKPRELGCFSALIAGATHIISIFSSALTKDSVKLGVKEFRTNPSMTQAYQ